MKEFEALLDRFGSDPAAWPSPARAGADRLLERSSEAREALAAAEELKARLRNSDVKAPPGLAQRIFKAATEAGGQSEDQPEQPSAQRKS